MIIIDKDRCSGCGLCAKICHQRCITIVDGTATRDYDLCDTCTQCISVCPQQALSWDHVPPVDFDNTRLPSLEQLDELFGQRRTIRFFKKKKIDRAVLEEIVSYGVYAPTTNKELRAVLIDDEALIEELEQINLRFQLRIYNTFVKPKLVFSLLSRVSPALDPKMKAKLERRRHDLFNPAAIVFIVGDRRIHYSEASAQYLLYNQMLCAHVKGVGTCLWGAGKIALDRDRIAREFLGLQKHEHILGTLLLGYAAVKFKSRMMGKTLDIQWMDHPGKAEKAKED